MKMRRMLKSQNESTKFQTQDERNSIYISAPITTGTNFLEWYLTRGIPIKESNEYKKVHYDEIITPNSEKILKFHQELSQKFNTPIIEPASFEMPGWSQDDYLRYWEEVINHSVMKIIFMDGWCYSKGCTYEYFIGLKKGIELVDQNQNPIDKSWAIEHIQKAISEYDKVSIDTDLQKKILKEIEHECK